MPTSRIVTSRKDLVATNESWLGLFVAHGITGIREMGTDIPEAVFQWREEINSGSRLGPRVLSAGPKIDIPGPGGWPGWIRITNAASARTAVQQVKSLGVDFVKLYANAYPPGVLETLTDEARRQHPPIGGHLPLGSSTAQEAMDSGLNFIEHIDLYIPAGCSREEPREAPN